MDEHAQKEIREYANAIHDILQPIYPNIIKAFDDMPWILKLVLCLPVLDIAWAVYRIVKGAHEKKTGTLVAGILWIIPGSVVCWLISLPQIGQCGTPTRAKSNLK